MPGYNITPLKRRASSSTADTGPYDHKMYQEGGVDAWLTITGSFLVYYASYGLVNSFGYFQNYYKSDFLSETSPSTIAFIGTLQILLMNILASISGALCDSYGIKYPYICSGVGVSSSLLILSFIAPGSVWQIFLVQGLLLGLSIAFGTQPALTVAGQHFKTRRALAMGVVTGGCALGGVCFPIMFSLLVPVIGFPWALRVAAVKIILCYSVSLSISTSKHTKKDIRNAYGKFLDFRGFLDSRYSVLCLGAWIAQVGIWVPNYYIELYCSTINPNTAFKNFFLPLINGTSIFGMIVGGLVGDRIGRLNLLCPVTLVLGTLCSIWLCSTTVLMLVIFSCLFGFFSGMFVALIPPVVSQISPDESLGARIGAFYSVLALSSLIGTPVSGALITDPTRVGYRGVIIYAGGTLTLGSVVMMVSRMLHDRNWKARW